MLLSFSVQDEQKLAEASGSMKDAFGVVTARDKGGVIERDGNPQRDYLKDMGREQSDGSTEFAADDHPDQQNQGQEANTYAREKTDVEHAAEFSLAAASLKQSWQDLPDITAVSDNIIVEPTAQGLDITIADQTGKAMFPEGSKYPFEITRKAIAAMAPALEKLPNQIRISGHTAAGTPPLQQSSLWRMGIVVRPRRCNPANSGGIRPRAGARAGSRGTRRHRAVLPQRSLSLGQPAGDDHRAVSAAAGAGWADAVEAAIRIEQSAATALPRRTVVAPGAGRRPNPDDALRTGRQRSWKTLNSPPAPGPASPYWWQVTRTRPQAKVGPSPTPPRPSAVHRRGPRCGPCGQRACPAPPRATRCRRSARGRSRR